MSQPARPAPFRSFSSGGQVSAAVAAASTQAGKQPTALPSISTNTQYSPQQHGSPSQHDHRRISDSGAQSGPSPNGGQRSDEPASGRSFKMHSILNPSSASDGSSRPTNRTPAEHGRSAAGTTFTQRRQEPHAVSPKTQTPQSLPPMSELYVQPHRPSEHSEPPRSYAQTHPHSAAAAGDTSSRSPFPSTTSTPQVGVANLPRSSYPFPPPSTTSTDRRGSDTNPTAPASQSNSPTTSYSSYGHTARNSPASHFSQVSAMAHAGPSYGSGGSQGHHLSMSSASSAPPGTYQLMTLDTGAGPIQVPVDVQAASKMADEKRKRNAGASARFRQRRKEKEREASHTISRLESEVREMGEQREYYRLERDYFRGLIYQSNAQIHVSPRLPSPKLRKSSIESSSGGSTSTTTAEAAMEWQQSGERGSDDGRNQRRRISGYDVPQPPQPQQHVQQHVQQVQQQQQQGYGHPPQHSTPAQSPLYAQHPQHPGGGGYPFPRQDPRDARPPSQAPAAAMHPGGPPPPQMHAPRAQYGPPAPPHYRG